MTFDEWWEDFVAEHDEWKYADSAALRRAGFQAGAASRDAEIAKLKEDLHFQACLTKYLMPYQERAVLAEKERDQLRAQINKLRESTELLLIARQIGHYRDEWDMLKEALAATPEQSLVEYRNKLIEQMIACYSPDDSAHDYFDKLNALKGQS